MDKSQIVLALLCVGASANPASPGQTAPKPHARQSIDELRQQYVDGRINIFEKQIAARNAEIARLKGLVKTNSAKIDSSIVDIEKLDRVSADTRIRADMSELKAAIAINSGRLAIAEWAKTHQTQSLFENPTFLACLVGFTTMAGGFGWKVYIDWRNHKWNEKRVVEAAAKMLEIQKSTKDNRADTVTNIRSVEKVMRTGFETQKAEMKEIHTLVNSNLTASITSVLVARQDYLALLEKTVAANKERGIEIDAVTEAALVTTKSRIANLLIELADRDLQTKEAASRLAFDKANNPSIQSDV